MPPVRYGKWGVTQPYGNPDPAYAKGYNRGTDYGMPEGTPVEAALGGVVVDVGQHPQWGNYVKVKDAKGYTHQYSHLSEPFVAVGDTISADAVVGASGSTGWATGPHLDYMVLDPQGNDVDPERYNMGYVFDEETGEYVWEDEEPEDGGDEDGLGDVPPGYKRVQEGWNYVFDPETGQNVRVPKYKIVRDYAAAPATDRGPARDYAAEIEEELKYKRERDAILDEERKEKEEYKRAIDEGRYKDAEAIRQRMTALQEKQQALDESYRRDQLKLTADIQYAGSRRADLDVNLRRQGQAFEQERVRREDLRATASRPSSYLEYAFDSAGVPAPPGTRLAELQRGIKRTPDVEDYLAGQYGTPQTVPNDQNLRMTPSGAEVQQELDTRRSQAQSVQGPPGTGKSAQDWGLPITDDTWRGPSGSGVESWAEYDARIQRDADQVNAWRRAQGLPPLEKWEAHRMLQDQLNSGTFDPARGEPVYDIGSPEWDAADRAKHAEENRPRQPWERGGGKRASTGPPGLGTGMVGGAQAQMVRMTPSGQQVAGRPMQYDDASVQQELEQIRARRRGGV